MKAPAFSPGKFKPVVEVSQSDTGLPAPVDTDFSGLEEAVVTTLDVSLSSARGYGSVVPVNIPHSSYGKVIGYVLACKNLVEQLNFMSVYARVSGPLRQSPPALEPIVRFYTYFGHFEYNKKVYVARGARDSLVYYLFKLRQWASDELASRTKNTIRLSERDFSNIALEYYHLAADGNIAFGKEMPLKQYLLKLATSLLGSDLADDIRIVVVRSLLDIATDEGLLAFLRRLKFDYPEFEPPPRTLDTSPTDEHKAAMKKLFGKEFSSDDDVIPVAKFSETIVKAYNLLRDLSQERGYVMKTTQFAKYEGGTSSQLAELTDDVLYSEVPLGLDESTVAVAITQSYGSRTLYRSAPNVDRDETRRSLVAQSLIMK